MVTLKLFLNAKCSLFLWSKLAFGHRRWFLNTNLFLIKPFLITKFDCTWSMLFYICILHSCCNWSFKTLLTYPLVDKNSSINRFCFLLFHWFSFRIFDEVSFHCNALGSFGMTAFFWDGPYDNCCFSIISQWLQIGFDSWWQFTFEIDLHFGSPSLL